jgi:hypothetical protein
MGPLHDWTSHAADAFRYLAISADKMSAQTPWEPLQYPSRGIV